MGRYILDFYCNEKNLCIELDGGQHGEAIDYDHQRDAWLRAQGVRVLRFWNNQMLAETEAVLEVIYQNLLAVDVAIALTPGPSPACGRGEQDSDLINRINAADHVADAVSTKGFDHG